MARLDRLGMKGQRGKDGEKRITRKGRRDKDGENSKVRTAR